jgi:hypothetical protein
MYVIAHQCPSIAGCGGFADKHPKPFKEDVSVCGISEDCAPVDPLNYDVMHGTGGIYAGFARHEFF